MYAGTVVVTNARVLTLEGPRPRRGAALADLGVIELGEVEIAGGVIRAVRRLASPRKAGPGEIDAAGRVLMPAFVDAHTHACFAGSRLDEWAMKLRGATYLEILKAGGGIMSTVRATRSSAGADLARELGARLERMRRAGTMACEVKSGYGLSEAGELLMLRALREASAVSGTPVKMTALLGHAIEGDARAFVDATISGTLPAVSREFPGIAVDAYCEEGAWSVRDTVRLLERARELGHPLRVHADQFNSLGMVGEAIRLGAVSVDHLEASPTDVLEALAASATYGVMLPICGLHLDGRYANAAWFVRSGGALCLASNYNPGSAPSWSMPLVIALATRFMGLSAAEAIAACTVNPATMLGLLDRGTIAPGQRGDLVLLRHTDERMLAYELDGSPIAMVLGA